MVHFSKDRNKGFVALHNNYNAQINDLDSVTGYECCVPVRSSAQIQSTSYR